MKARALPTATYRLQLNRDFTFADAARIIPYLHALGISHVYASPFLKARSGSRHGYDIVDHNALNPEIGDAASFAAYAGTLHRHGMGQILDIVPNHMGVGGDDNAWWLDVLENGESSRYAAYFDIDWHPVNPALHNKVLLPFLGDHYGKVLEQGELSLGFDPDTGAFGVHYYEHLFPIDPRTYPQILGLNTETLAQQLGAGHEALAELNSIIADCKSLPRRTELSAARRQRRRQGIAACRRRLAGLCQNQPEIDAFVRQNVASFNGTAGRSKSFDQLHRLLEAQAYRLAYWQVASDEINYRRFFDINELAGIRMENREVFDVTHRFIRQLIHEGQVDGLRVDHPDGLFDPFRYCHDLRRLAHEAVGDANQRDSEPFYVLVEKILASYEHLPADWPVTGTTGYEVAHLINGLFIYPGSERALDRLYRRFTGSTTDFDELLYERKKLIIRNSLSSELTVLANLLSGIARIDRHTRDFTYHGLRDALGETVACFPVYRTYITYGRVSDEDGRYVQWAIAQAKKRNPAADLLIFDFIHELLMFTQLGKYSPNIQRKVIQFTLRFQQYTAPVMAKGMEDTAFYIYNRLVSLNDVGCDPRAFGISVSAFHYKIKQRLADWPHAMAATSTHDSKHGQDVRARINVLSELPDEWRQHLRRWTRLNRNKKRLVNDKRAPSRNDEYLLYQTLVGTWPMEPPGEAGLAAYRDRIEACMLKAIKEAKVHTSWINPNEEYEEAMRHFVRVLLEDPERNAFLADFLQFQRQIGHFGLYNGLSQTLLKLTVPGIPDIYQGNELWAFNLVDPDNRRPVDYSRRQAMLQALIEQPQDAGQPPASPGELLGRLEDGRAKLYLTWKILTLRRDNPDLFLNGEYIPLEARGGKADHICAFARRLDGRTVVTAAPRWFALLTGEQPLPPGREVWLNTVIEAPPAGEGIGYINVLTNTPVNTIQHNGANFFAAGDLFAHFPAAVLLGG